jgi:type IX secretion system PorP/SprF family membrane protein
VIKKGIHIILFVMCCKIALGQDPQFSQPYASALYLNPALTGDTKLNRVAMTFRNQWTAINNGYMTYMVSFDHYERKINAGFGGYILYDQSGSNGYRVTGLRLNYSYDARIDHWSGIKGGISVGYSLMNINQNDLLFADQIIRGGSVPSVETGLSDQTSYFDIGAGLLYYNKFVWAGVAVNHLSNPNISFNSQVDRLPLKFSVHTGISVWKKYGNWGKELSSINIAFNYKFQDKWDQMDIGAYYNYYPFVIGVWYRGIPLLKSYEPNYTNHESLILLVGLDYKNKFRVGYSYDFTISQLTMSSGGSHELTLVYEWPGNSKRTRKRRIACPKF